MVPKSERPDDLRAVAAILDDVGAGTRILALLETPLGVARALEVGLATPRVDALCFGHADFALEMGVSADDPSKGVLYHARCAVAVAARGCGVQPVDNVCLAVRDEEALRRDVPRRHAARLRGKALHSSEPGHDCKRDVYARAGRGRLRAKSAPRMAGSARGRARGLHARRQDGRRPPRTSPRARARTGAARGPGLEGSLMTEHVEQRIEVDGPYFEDFTHGQVFEAPSVTLTSGFAALHQALFRRTTAPSARRGALPRGHRERCPREPWPREQHGHRTDDVPDAAREGKPLLSGRRAPAAFIHWRYAQHTNRSRRSQTEPPEAGPPRERARRAGYDGHQPARRNRPSLLALPR